MLSPMLSMLSAALLPLLLIAELSLMLVVFSMMPVLLIMIFLLVSLDTGMDPTILTMRLIWVVLQFLFPLKLPALILLSLLNLPACSQPAITLRDLLSLMPALS
jgi:hypothetical protein